MSESILSFRQWNCHSKGGELHMGGMILTKSMLPARCVSTSSQILKNVVKRMVTTRTISQGVLKDAKAM
jgi:hypothetical protein